ncbi:MAG TPA: outer membrane beta-barrel protein, partial [Blastocatellia bacterium]|nr:outer membrane beta-barrel protein [Blastocatellia bacterium]
MINTRPSDITKVPGPTRKKINGGAERNLSSPATKNTREVNKQPSRVALRVGALRFYMRHRSSHNPGLVLPGLGRLLIFIAALSLLWPATAGYARQVNTDQPRDGSVETPPKPASKEAGKPDKSDKSDKSATLDNSPAKASETASTDSPGLTERERLLLDRIDRLERRVAELESRSTSNTGGVAAPGSPTATVVASRPAAVQGAIPSAIAGVPNANAPASPPGDPSTLQAAKPEVAAQSPAVAPANARGQKPEKNEPFSFGDFTWLTGNSRQKDFPLETKVFTGEVRADVAYVHDFNHPQDDSIGGSSEIFRSNEFQLTQFGIGGDFHWNNVRARLMTQFGMYAETTPRNDASVGRGQWDLDTAYRYISEAYGGYHIDKLNGINIDAGIFMSYVGLFSYYQFDNWAYQPSYVSSNTPWFFNGMRIQIFPSEKLKIEPWLVNGWQSYGKFNKAPGVGLQVLWRPNSSISVLGNQYVGTDTLGIPGRKRIHTDDSIQVKYLDRPARALDKAAFTFTFDAGCEFGQNSGVACHGGNAITPSQYFLGFMAYNRFWFHHDLFGLTLGGGAITNPGRYLVLLPPINGATAFSGTPYFTENPGDKFRAWDASLTFDYMPTQFSTFRFEYNHRASNVPYFSGPGGITPPGGNTGPAGSFVPGFFPDLRKFENRLT